MIMQAFSTTGLTPKLVRSWVLGYTRELLFINKPFGLMVQVRAWRWCSCISILRKLIILVIEFKLAACSIQTGLNTELGTGICHSLVVHAMIVASYSLSLNAD